MRLTNVGMAICMAVGMLAMTREAFPEATREMGSGQVIVTVLPANDGKVPGIIRQQDLQVKVNGKEPTITTWTPYSGSGNNLELVILIDDSARPSLGLRFEDISRFIQNLPTGGKVAIGYMNAGRAVLSGPLSTNHAEVAQELRIPGGSVGSSASPYFCLSDLAKKWPSNDRSSQREVVLITDGADDYYPGFNPNDPYVNVAINDSIRAGLVVYSIYSPNRSRATRSESEGFAGQNLLTVVSRATGGFSYNDGINRESVSLRPYFDDIALRIQNQYRLAFQFPWKGKPALQNLTLKIANMDIHLFAPQQVFVTHPSSE